MSRLKLFIVLGFAIMFVAGLEVGRSHTSLTSLKGDWDRLIARIHGTGEVPATPPGPKIKPLFGKIELTQPQHDQIQKIMGDARASADAMSKKIPAIDQERDDDIVALLTPDQKFQYDEILRNRSEKVGAIRAQIAATMKKAGDQVRELLTPEQQKQFDEERQKWDSDHQHHGQHHLHAGPDTAPDHAGPQTAPAK